MYLEIDEIAALWDNHWSSAQKLARATATPSQVLDDALMAFIATALEDDEGGHDKRVVIGRTLAGVSRAGTHTKVALDSSFHRLFLADSSGRPFIRKWIALSAIWLGTVATGFAIFADRGSAEIERAFYLAVLPPALVGFSILAWRWSSPRR